MPYQRFAMNKLVRDKIPEVTAAKGIRCHVTRLEKPAHMVALLKKLHEEADEAIAAQGQSGWLSELADLQEVLDALVKMSGHTTEDLLTLQTKKRETRGGFELGLYLIYSDHPEHDTETQEMLMQPNIYPSMGQVE